MTKKRFNAKSKITALVLSLLLIIGMIPLQVFAAEPTEDTVLMEGMIPTGEVKVAQFPNSSTQLVLMTMDSRESSFARELFYSISKDGLSYSIPLRVKKDLTNDLYPFIYTPTGSSSQNDLIITWTDADKKFDTDISPEDAASSMRISIAVMNGESLSFSVEPYTFSVPEAKDSADESEGSEGEPIEVCHYKSRITKIDGKILVTWVVCSDIKQKEGSFSVVGMYYNPDTNTFSTDDNKKDKNGNLIPMTYVDGRNYISEYSVAKFAGGIAVLFEEDTDISDDDEDTDGESGSGENADGEDSGESASEENKKLKGLLKEIYGCTTDSNYNYPYSYKDTNKNTELNLAVSGKVTNLAPSGDYGSVVESSMPYLSYYYNNSLYNISDNTASLEGWITFPILDVSGTGDTRYSFITKNSTVEYIAAREDTPIKTDKTEIYFRGKHYTKSADGKWLDDKGKSYDIYQENIRLYYREPSENEPVLLPLGLIDKDEFVFSSSPMPSFLIDNSDRLTSVWITEYKEFGGSRATLSSVIYSRENLLKANYKAVKEAIAMANALNQSDYSNYSTVTDAINTVVYDKGYKEQATVDAYATAIENAINSLTLRGADYTEVDAAIAKANAINADLYKNYADVTAAVNAVDRIKNFKQQADVDLMAKAINNAIAALEYKDADYTAVDDAIARANSLNSDDYKNFTYVETAINNVVRGKNIIEQSSVDLMAKAINEAISGLVYKDADYSNVNVAIAKANALDKTLYKNYSLVETALNSVVFGKNITEQSEADAMAVALENAIAALEYKDADYSRVDAAIAKANSLDRNDYKDFAAVDAAVGAVVRGKNITEQTEVDAMATAILNAVSDLEYKETNNNTENKDNDDKKSTPAPSKNKAQSKAPTDYKKSPQTGTADTMLWVAFLFISGGIIITVTSFSKRKKRLKISK